MKIFTVNSNLSSPLAATQTEEIDEKRIEAEEQHSVVKTLLLHLVPGVLIYAIFLATAPLFESWGYPGIMGLILGSTVVLLPTLAELYRLGKKRNGKLSLKGIVLYRQRMPWWEYIVWTVLACVYAYAVLHTIVPLFQERVMGFFTWWPGYQARLNLGSYPKAHVTIVLALYIVMNALYPIIEELYFRGFLMPRIARFGAWTPLISMVLFSLYHLWQPWNNPLNLITLWPLTFLPWKKRNIYLAILIHCALNISGMLIK